ncbi:deoxyribodipyrimidine photolyase [Halorubrum ezzemoulense DSM 17463]|uniref:Deoxyribodipyrimidine photolyase n=1 Tax=Halorubrum ezzemoulense DSM 17463 TaxID=1121945 RepID=A0A1X4GAG3_HALEZ|nr:deoxyribodipyrimidine photo-lyase [Halorubrum ezzemoulense]OSO94171.1 deoxyribodipyrimidine photolyase [Halorubrum ezzemoulense DSM 17463]
MELFWHRRDLRVADNVGLAAAAGAGDGDTSEDADQGPAAPVFVFDPDVLDHASDVRVRRLLDGLAALREAYRERGSGLIVAHGDPEALLPRLAEALGAERVVWNRDYSGLARERDAGVRRALDAAGVAREAHHDAVLHDPDAIRTNAGDPYSVYSYYWKKWTDRAKDDPLSAPTGAALAAADRLTDAVDAIDGTDAGDATVADAGVDALPVATVGDLPPPADLGFAEPDADVGPAGTAAARERLSDFLDEAVFAYEAERDYPAEDATSRLSTFLKYGEIGVREAYAATEEAMAEAASDARPDDAPEQVEEFQQQLAWREFYTQVLFHNPEVVTANYKEYEEGIDWRDDPDEIAAWKRGETGYPIVDAGMRQLREEAFIHNRVRMIVASFLTKDLLADWRHGYDHFRERLADHDTANDNGGWQWAASTGTDAQPYFRIFNPMTQGERYDPDAEYITAYVPELRGVEPDLIHEWHELSPTQRANAAPAYPAPIVDHSERREEALAMYKRARGEDPEED